MTRLWAKYALCFLVIATVWDVASHRSRRTKREKSAHKEALMDWEQEGGALPHGPALK
jgi:hypothetical protein